MVEPTKLPDGRALVVCSVEAWNERPVGRLATIEDARSACDGRCEAGRSIAAATDSVTKAERDRLAVEVEQLRGRAFGANAARAGRDQLLADSRGERETISQLRDELAKLRQLEKAARALRDRLSGAKRRAAADGCSMVASVTVRGDETRDAHADLWAALDADCEQGGAGERASKRGTCADCGFGEWDHTKDGVRCTVAKLNGQPPLLPADHSCDAWHSDKPEPAEQPERRDDAATPTGAVVVPREVRCAICHEPAIGKPWGCPPVHHDCLSEAKSRLTTAQPVALASVVAGEDVVEAVKVWQAAHEREDQAEVRAEALGEAADVARREHDKQLEAAGLLLDMPQSRILCEERAICAARIADDIRALAKPGGEGEGKS